MPPTSECELKLSVSVRDMPKARSALRTMARGRWARQALRTTYYDSKDTKLRHAHLELRVRKQGRQFIQTVKSNDVANGAVSERGEWEDLIQGSKPRLDAPQSGVQVRGRVVPEDLHPLFSTIVQRSVLMLSPRRGTEIEAAIDRGEIHCNGRDAPISEIELELKRGEREALWDVALRLLDAVPCRIDAFSKSERGYRLARAAGIKSAIAHPGPFPLPLDPQMTLDTALQVAGRHLLGTIIRNEAAALENVTEAIHQMRVTARRLRAVLATAQKIIPQKQYRWANEELRWIARELGPARNWDVFVVELLDPVNATLSGQSDLNIFTKTVEHERRRARDHVREVILSRRYTESLMRLSRWFDASGWREQSVAPDLAQLMAPLRDVAPKLLSRLHRKAMKRARHFASLSPSDRHRLRIALKKLRYAIDFLAPLYKKGDVEKYLDRMKLLQDDLGHANDVRSAQSLIASLRNTRNGAVERAGGLVLGWHDRALIEAEPIVRAHVRRFCRSKPFW